MTDLELACSLVGYTTLKVRTQDNGIHLEIETQGDSISFLLDAKDALTLGAALIMFAGKL